MSIIGVLMDHKVLAPSLLPISGSLAILMIALGIVNWLHGAWFGPFLLFIGVAGMIAVAAFWFHAAIQDDLGITEDQYALSEQYYRWSMGWFIFSELWFFIAFFGVLFYLRMISVPRLAGGFADDRLTHYLLWPSFVDQWPLLNTPDPSRYLGPGAAMQPWGLPVWNTFILLTSGLTITLAHWGIVSGRKRQALLWQLTTVFLGCVFLFLQGYEYAEAYIHLDLRFNSGVYANVFYIMTGFHGIHVFLGTIMLVVIAFRIYYDDFSPERHFAFEAVSWYWHFVDVIWLLLFVFVYWL